jgi:hypothetical protein
MGPTPLAVLGRNSVNATTANVSMGILVYVKEILNHVE